MSEPPPDCDRPRWNLAVNLALNCVLRDAGLTPPEDKAFPSDHGLEDGLTALQYYELLASK